MLFAPSAVRPKRFPEMTLTLALCVPFMSGDLDLESELITSGIAAAETLAGPSGAHLRLVGLSSPTGTGTGATEGAVEALVSLALRLGERNGVLALENAIHPWDQLLPLFQEGRGTLQSRKTCLQLCLDPCNVHLHDPAGADPEVPEGLQATDLSMVHIKQSGNGRVLPVVEEGDVDWSFALRRLRGIGFSGPLLLEIAPSMEVWEQVERSVQFLDGLEARGTGSAC